MSQNRPFWSTVRRCGILQPIFHPYYRLKRRREICALRVESDLFLDSARGVIHVGGHNGGEILQYAKRKLPVVWIEANPHVFPELLANLRGVPRQKALQGLVGGQNLERRDFFLSNNDGASSSVFPFDQHEILWPGVAMACKIALPQFTLPELLSRAEVDASAYDTLVLDVQGAELEILSGIPRLSDTFPRLQFEAANFSLYQGAPHLREIETFLKKEGFVRHSQKIFAQDSKGRQCMDCRYLSARGGLMISPEQDPNPFPGL